MKISPVIAQTVLWQASTSSDEMRFRQFLLGHSSLTPDQLLKACRRASRGAAAFCRCRAVGLQQRRVSGPVVPVRDRGIPARAWESEMLPMKTYFVACLTLLITVAAATALAEETKEIVLFDGKDTAGW